MRDSGFRRLLLGALLSTSVVAGAPALINAQTTTQDRPAVETPMTQERDGDTDWGWIGLLGLAGLLGLRRRDRHEHRVDTTRRNVT